jgi:hypothetical protein
LRKVVVKKANIAARQDGRDKQIGLFKIDSSNSKYREGWSAAGGPDKIKPVYSSPT